MIDSKIKPFIAGHVCVKCGAGEILYPPPALHMHSVTIRFCSGGKEPESPLDVDPMTSSFQAAMNTLSSVFPQQIVNHVGEQRGKLNICAGIAEEHLHATCNNCQYEFLIQTKDSPVTEEAPCKL